MTGKKQDGALYQQDLAHVHHAGFGEFARATVPGVLALLARHHLHGGRVVTWSLEVEVPIGTRIEYKYTNSGPAGDWEPGQEFPQVNRKYTVEKPSGNRVVLSDRFGTL